MASRETIYLALFSRLATISLLQTASRRLRHWDDVADTDCPALFLVAKNETPQRTLPLPSKRTFHADIYVYVKADQASDAVPASELNPVIDAIEEALQAEKISGRQTLGGVVHDCYIDGTIETDEGLLGSVAAALIPVVILLP